MQQSIILRFSLTLLIFGFQSLWAQDSLTTYELGQDIVITANRIPTAFRDIARTISVINQTEIQNSAAQSLPELLENVLGVDVQQRGTQGIQADISIRGAGFNQTLVLLNGLKMIDPQTGHHNMNLPLDISDIDRIEVLRGPGSRLYGPNAFGGVINIITKHNDQLSVTIGGLYGEHNLYNSHINFNVPIGHLLNRVTVSKYGSDGYIRNSDFQNLNISQNSKMNLGSYGIELSSGYNEKSFGASTFYTTRFPDQYESTILRFVQGGFYFTRENLNLKMQAFYRSHYDDFTLFRRTPELYTNIHRTNSYGSELSGSYSSNFGITSFGAEVTREEINSNNLGEHDRVKSGLFIQQQFKLNSLLVAFGASAYNYSEIGWKGWPGIDASYKLNDNSKIHSSISYGFRIPTYTELFYSDPATQGNKNLKSESSVNYEMGYTYWTANFISELTIFHRKNNNMIDYVFDDTDDIFRARNFTEILTNGIEISATKKNIGFLNSIFLKYAYLESEIDLFGAITRYNLIHFKHQLLMGGDYILPLLRGLKQSWKLRYDERLLPSKQTTVDTRLTWTNDALRIYMDITNILDEKYEDIPGVAAPGRWIKFGFEYNLYSQ